MDIGKEWTTQNKPTNSSSNNNNPREYKQYRAQTQTKMSSPDSKAHMSLFFFIANRLPASPPSTRLFLTHMPSLLANYVSVFFRLYFRCFFLFVFGRETFLKLVKVLFFPLSIFSVFRSIVCRFATVLFSFRINIVRCISVSTVRVGLFFLLLSFPSIIIASLWRTWFGWLHRST